MTKKFFAALAMLAVLLTSSIALAAFEESIEEDADLLTVKRIAVAFPNYYKVEEKEPETHELMKDVYGAGKMNSSREILSYEEIASAIRRDTGIDIRQLDVNEAEKVYNSNIARYADAFVITTIANNSGKPWLFFYIYNSLDQKLMYTYSVQGRLIGKNAKDYYKAAEDFFKQFDDTAAKKLSKEERKAYNEKKRELKASKKKAAQVTYKTGKSKVDLVRKK